MANHEHPECPGCSVTIDPGEADIVYRGETFHLMCGAVRAIQDLECCTEERAVEAEKVVVEYLAVQHMERERVAAYQREQAARELADALRDIAGACHG